MQVSRQDSFTIQVLQITDAILVWFAFFFAGLTRDSIHLESSLITVQSGSLAAMSWVLYIAVPFTPLILDRFGFYERIRSKTLQATAWQLIQGLVVIGLFISVYAVFFKVEGTRRLLLGMGAVYVFILLFARSRITRFWITRRKGRGLLGEKVVVAGSESEIEELLLSFDPEAIADWDVVERFDLASRSSDELFSLLKRKSVGRVVFATNSIEFDKVAEAVEVCELQGVEAWIAASFVRTQIARPVFDSVGSKPMLVLRSTPELSWELMAKGLIDRVGSFLVILASLPLWIVAFIGIKIASPGAPVFFSQMRAGRYGQPFRMWKFRTMVPDAEELLQKMKDDHGNQMEGPVFKLENDPRIFPFGRILRRLSIDELPQLINVFCGEMSLVGPRPLPVYEIEAIGKIAHRRRLSVKPGITCEWQAGGRNSITSFEDWVEMDLRYIDNWSLWLDFQILLRTIPAVLFSRGAK